MRRHGPGLIAGDLAMLAGTIYTWQTLHLWGIVAGVAAKVICDIAHKLTTRAL